MRSLLLVRILGGLLIGCEVEMLRWSVATSIGVVAIFCATTGCASSPYPPGVDLVQVASREEGAGPRILAVVAHPDDEIAFAGLLYKASTALDGVCDIVTVTNGEGGFKYATLAESIYDLELTDPDVGRRELPAIRKRELTEGCRFLAVRRLLMLRQTDHRFTLDPAEVLAPTANVWDVPFVRRALREILEVGDYDFVVTHTPVAETHGHHKAATLLALAAVEELAPERRPVVLGVRGSRKDEALPGAYEGLEGYPETQQRGEAYTFDRNAPFGYNDRLNYNIVVNWAIAAHKSQGTMQLLMGRGDQENYYLYQGNAPGVEGGVATFFESLRQPQFEKKTYDASADARIGGA